MGDDYSCPDSDENDDCGYYWADYTCDDDIASPARNMVGKSRRHFADKLPRIYSVMGC